MGVSPLFKMRQLLNILLFVSVGLATAAAAAGEKQPQKKREPKLFYVSTTTTTSTWFGSTICFASTTTTLGTCGKRKRSIDLSDFDPDYTPKIEPSALSDEVEDNFEDSALVEPSQDENGRSGRFLVYWMTTTSVSTSSSYTTTLTVASLTCTPSSFAFSLCG